MHTHQNGIRSWGWFFERVGAPLIFMIAVFAIYTGAVPSFLSRQHDDIQKDIDFNQAAIIQNLYLQDAICRRLAELENPPDTVLIRGLRRCDESRKSMEQFLRAFKRLESTQ